MSEALNKAREARKAMAEAGIAVVRTTPLEKSQANPTSLRLAVNANCYCCMGQGADPGWKWSIGNCLVSSCPLLPVRPYKRLEGKPMPASIRIGNDGEATAEEPDDDEEGE